MRLKNILLTTILLFIPMLSLADDTKKNDSVDINTLIEKAKKASSEERAKIEELIKKKIAKAHRDSRS